MLVHFGDICHTQVKYIRGLFGSLAFVVGIVEHQQDVEEVLAEKEADRMVPMLRLVIALALTAPWFSAGSMAEEKSFGTLVSCDHEQCLWTGKHDQLVSGRKLCEQMLRDEDLEQDREARRNLRTSITYLEGES